MIKTMKMKDNPEELVDKSLTHFGVQGMRWGVRNDNSPNTQARRSRAKMYKNRRTISDAELKKTVNRMQMEKKLKTLVEDDLIPGKVAVRDFLSKTGAALVGAAAGAAGAALVKDYLLKKATGG